jgi:trehalose 6-phosphate phosphatase
MRASTRRLLESVAVRYPCVVISGRSREDVAGRVACAPVWHVCGNHGLEPWGQLPGYVPQVRAWKARLQSALQPLQGVSIEDKTYSLTVHYRAARRKRLVTTLIENELRRLRGARCVPGKECVSVVPRDAPHKGIAIDRARRLLACDRVIFVGDDETDEDGFAAAPPGQLLGIRVGRLRGSKAGFHITRQAEIDLLLRALLSLRQARAWPQRLS